MKFKQGDIVDVEGYLGEVIKVTDTYIEVLYGGEALHYCVEKYDIDDARVVLNDNTKHKKPNSDQLSGEGVESLILSFFISYYCYFLTELIIKRFSKINKTKNSFYPLFPILT